MDTFLRAVKAKEKQFIEDGRLKESEISSTRMRESWESGCFWLTYAARRTWAFDAIYWKILDKKSFCKNQSGDIMDRLKPLPPEQVNAMGDMWRGSSRRGRSVGWWIGTSLARSQLCPLTSLV